MLGKIDYVSIRSYSYTECLKSKHLLVTILWRTLTLQLSKGFLFLKNMEIFLARLWSFNIFNIITFLQKGKKECFNKYFSNNFLW